MQLGYQNYQTMSIEFGPPFLNLPLWGVCRVLGRHTCLTMSNGASVVASTLQEVIVGLATPQHSQNSMVGHSGNDPDEPKPRCYRPLRLLSAILPQMLYSLAPRHLYPRDYLWRSVLCHSYQLDKLLHILKELLLLTLPNWFWYVRIVTGLLNNVNRYVQLVRGLLRYFSHHFVIAHRQRLERIQGDRKHNPFCFGLFDQLLSLFLYVLCSCTHPNLPSKSRTTPT